MDIAEKKRYQRSKDLKVFDDQANDLTT